MLTDLPLMTELDHEGTLSCWTWAPSSDILHRSNMKLSLTLGAFLLAQTVKKSACNVGDLGSIPGLERSPGEGNGYPLQYSCLENPMDRGAWWATVHGVTKSQT